MDRNYDYHDHDDYLCQQLDRHGWLLAQHQNLKTHHHQLMDFFPLALLVDYDQ
jgi:hypothetical protein